MIRLTLILTSLAAVAFTSVKATPPTGVFDLPSSKIPEAGNYTNPKIDGFVVGASWDVLEHVQNVVRFDQPIDGVSGHDSFDTVIGKCEAVGKPMMLLISVGGAFTDDAFDAGNKPTWLRTLVDADSYPAESKYMIMSDKSVLPAYWEPTYLERLRLLELAVGAHIASHPLIKVIFVSLAAANTNDWNPGDTGDDDDTATSPATSPNERWAKTLTGVAPYDTFQNALTYAGKKIYDDYWTAMPNRYFLTSIGRVTDTTLNPGATHDNSGRNICEDIVNDAIGKHPGWIMPGKNSLNGGYAFGGSGAPPNPGTGTAWNDLLFIGGGNERSGFQEVWHSSDDCKTAAPPQHDYSGDPHHDDPYYGARMNYGINAPCIPSSVSLRNSIDVAVSYNAAFVEIYEKDIDALGATNTDGNAVIDPAFGKDQIAYGHDRLYSSAASDKTPLASRKVAIIMRRF